ncbi:MAG: hypothetical protein K2F82_00080 [Muribaculaceae bacterium]|nr:hypothetical protein [Muribaculaceae bacterium]
MRLRLILRTLAASPWLTAFKVLALGLGLAMGSFLLMRVARDHSVDRCFPDYERIHQLWVTARDEGKGVEQRMPVMPTEALANQMREKLADYMEISTVVFNGLTGNMTTDTGVSDMMTMRTVDRYFFDTFGLKTPTGRRYADDVGMKALWFNDEEARRFFGNDSVEGHDVIITGGMPGKTVGTFTTIPEESTLSDIKIICQDPTVNFGFGRIYVKMKKGADVMAFNREIQKIWQGIQPDTETIKSVIEAAPLTDTFHADEKIQLITLTMSVLAGLVIFVTAMNYVLLSLASLRRRAKTVGVQKCNGASGLSIAVDFAAETILLMLASLVVVAAVFYASEHWFADTLGYSVTHYVSTSRLWVLGVVMAVVFAVSAIVPGVMMARIPAAQAFRRFRQKRGGWKTALLSLEIAATAFALGLTAVVMRQYSYITESDRGFNPERLVLVGVGMGRDSRVVDDIVKGLPYVESACWATLPPGITGNDWYEEFLLDDATEVYAAHPAVHTSFFRILNIPMITGKVEGVTLREESWSFTSGEERAIADVAVTRSFATDLLHCTPEEAIGKQISIGQPGDGYCQPMNIAAVCENVKYGGYFAPDRPVVFRLHSEGVFGRLILKLQEPFEANVDRLRRDIDAEFPDNDDISLNTYEDMMRKPYAEINSFRILAIISSVMILLIGAMGLLAYLRDEIARRTKEIAIRKINGATATDIVEMLAMSVVKVAVPAAAVGAIGAWVVALLWMEQFADTIGSGVDEICAASLALLLVIASAVALMALRTAQGNPTESLRSE